MDQHTSDSYGTPAVFPAQVAGLFYSDNPEQLNTQIQSLMQQANKATHCPKHPPKAIIAPHAGHRFSGRFAAIAYRHIMPAQQQIKRVVIFGPAHKMAFNGLAVTNSAQWQTPLGPINVDSELAQSITTLPNVSQTNQPFEGEHCLEVHLPFLQKLLPEFSIVPILVSRCKTEDISRVFDLIWDDPSTLILISSDLSHFHTDEKARGIDLQTRRAIELLDSNGLQPQTACGSSPVKALLAAAKSKGLRPTTLAMGNSADAGGDKNRVVGYGSWRFDALETAETPNPIRQDLLGIATQAIGYFGQKG